MTATAVHDAIGQSDIRRRGPDIKRNTREIHVYGWRNIWPQDFITFGLPSVYVVPRYSMSLDVRTHLANSQANTPAKAPEQRTYVRADDATERRCADSLGTVRDRTTQLIGVWQCASMCWGSFAVPFPAEAPMRSRPTAVLG